MTPHTAHGAGPASRLPPAITGYTKHGVMWQVLIHITFVVSATGIAFVDRLSDTGGRRHEA